MNKKSGNYPFNNLYYLFFVIMVYNTQSFTNIRIIFPDRYTAFDHALNERDDLEDAHTAILYKVCSTLLDKMINILY